MERGPEYPPLNLPPCDLRIRDDGGEWSVFDSIRRKYVRLTPEEWVRQHFVHFLIRDCGYPASLTAIEMGFRFQRMPRRADVVVHDRQGSPFLMAECKAPDVRVGQNTFDQVSRYNRVVEARYLVVTNGLEHYCWRIESSAGRLEFQEGIPPFEPS